ncbi:right-handed parallel beta-helix repeat-containing protein [Rubripirellula amarantea]|uniref:right-handed parallel beta-helix repeat-containing protein n=1 Tax=Rubripirellula amarantea TaxID=2527999 RepID=UPI0028F459D1|nr:right-handed parallel beta-helix repeat-containing protein [Rubripirellula amarantea]
MLPLHVSGQEPRLPSEATGADESIFAAPPDVTYIVDPVRGSDTRGSGVASRPLKTLQRALELAERSYTRSSKIRISLLPGKYREENFFDAKRPGPSGYLHIVASEPRRAIITGMDDWTGTDRAWKKESDGSFSKPWTLRWGFEKRGRVHGPEAEFDESLITRREWIVMNENQVLRQVLEREKLEPGTFFVDDQSSLVYVRPPVGLNPNRDLIEVATRPSKVPYEGWMWTFWNMENFKIEGLTFTGSAAFPNGANLHLGRGCKNVVIEDCAFERNGSGGLNFDGDDTGNPPQFKGVTKVTVRNCVASDNGTSGFHGSCNNGIVVSSKFERNNIRGHWAGSNGWAIAGAKFVRSHRLRFQNNDVTDNLTGGMWLDIRCSDVQIDGCRVKKNVGTDQHGNSDQCGIYVETCRGPILIENTEISGSYIGVQIGNSHDVTIRDCKIANNEFTQLGLESRDRGDDNPKHNERLLVTDNFMASQDNAMLVRQIWSDDQGDLELSLAGLRSTQFVKNRYFASKPSTSFMAMDLSSDSLSWQTMTFNQWKQRTGFDTDGSTLNQQTELGGSAGSPLSADQFDEGDGITVFDGGFGDLGESDGVADWVCYRNFDFGQQTNQATITFGVPESHAGGKVEIRVDSVDGPLLGTVTVASTGGWSQHGAQTFELESITGQHDVYLVGRETSVVGNIYEIHFQSKTP